MTLLELWRLWDRAERHPEGFLYPPDFVPLLLAALRHAYDSRCDDIHECNECDEIEQLLEETTGE